MGQLHGEMRGQGAAHGRRRLLSPFRFRAYRCRSGKILVICYTRQGWFTDRSSNREGLWFAGDGCAMSLLSSALLTDLYQLTMLQGYFEQRMEEMAVFELFIRNLPRQRGFLLAAGLEQALDYLEQLQVMPDELEWLAASGRFSRDFVDYLGRLRFTGDVLAMPEGTVFFPPEPILRVMAPLPQAQLVESRLINLLHFETMIASKAARAV